ncbi:MAG TPA: pilus assembly protein TadG-related protein [Devosia sp.]
MRRLFDLVVRFRRDERGAFAVIFGVVAIVMVALSGAVVDYVGIEQARSRGQIALDAAALALQPRIYSATVTKADITKDAQALLVDRLGANSGVTGNVVDVQIDLDAGALYLRATLSTSTAFVSLVGVPKLTASIESEATRKKLELEVAFVLDNSGSMSYTGAGTNGTRQRIQFLKDAAKCAVNILFYKDVVNSSTNPDTCVPASGASVQDDVKIGIVPFNMMVNVGPSNAGANWMDKTGNSATSNDNLDNDDDETTSVPIAISKFSMFAATGESWRGCVEARPHIKTGTLATEYLDTDDTTPLSGNTLFVPMFSPDMVDNVGANEYVRDSPAVCDRPSNIGANCTVKRRRTGCNSTNSNCSASEVVVSSVASGNTNISSSQIISSGYFYGANAPSCDCRNRSNNTWQETQNNNNVRTFELNYSCQGGGYTPTGLSLRELQERMCKYYGPLDASAFNAGPNADCVRTAILPLSSTPATVISTITGMTAEGGTNIHEGTAWGFRTLSPTLPFDQGGVYNEARAKIMILMTDGENTAYNLSDYCNATQRGLNGNCYNSAYGFPYNSLNTGAGTSGGNFERLGKPGGTSNGAVSTAANANFALVTEMNTRLRQTCENAKAKGITIYVIGMATSQAVQSSQAEVEDLLADCASTRDKAYFPQEPSELKTVFQVIANDLTQLRLAK